VFSWTNLKFVLSAAGPGTVLEFGAENAPNYFGLDDVSVTPIPAPVFQSVAAEGGSITLTWSAMTGMTYQLQYATSLCPPDWSDLGAPILAGSDSITASDIIPQDPQRFYRVVFVP
jgi:hypothetical protein